MSAGRSLIVVADDFGIGPATDRAVVELAATGVVSAAVLLSNSPHAATAVRAWRAAAPRADLGWHPCLTMDAPVAPAGRVASLVGADGKFHSLSRFLVRLHLGRIDIDHVRTELAAQYRRFIDLSGHVPLVVNSHHHIALFGRVGAVLREVLRWQRPRPFLRRVVEPVSTLWRVPGARFKRLGLTLLGRRTARRQEHEGFPGARWLGGITDPRWVRDPEHFSRWLASVPGSTVELMVHPGYHDRSLVGRDCGRDDPRLRRRVDELQMLRRPAFLEACREAGFTLTVPSALCRAPERIRYVA